MSYDAFVSYSHGADTTLAPALRDGLQRFAKPWWKLRACRVFLDQSVLGAESSLGTSLHEAITGSRFLILLASPQAAASVWVGREVETWLSANDPSRLLLVLTEGTIAWDEAAGDFDRAATNALPPVLRGVFASEPLWVDLSWAREASSLTLRDARFAQAVARLAARIHGRSLDEIAGEDVRQHRRTRQVAWSAVGALTALLVAAVTAGWLSVLARQEAERNLAIALDSADTIVANVAEDLEDLVGVPQSLRVRMLVRAGDVLDRLDRGGGDESLQRSRAMAQAAVAGAYVAIGKPDEARRRAVSAMETLRRLAPQSGDAGLNLDHLRTAWVAGDVLRRSGALGEARDAYLESVAAAQRATVLEPAISADESLLVLRARALVGLGDTYWDSARAGVPVCESAATCVKLTKQAYADSMQGADGPAARIVNISVVARDRLGRVAQWEGDLAAARTHFDAALASVAALHDADPGNARWQENLMAMHWRVSGIALAGCDAESAGEHAEAALALAESLHRSDEENADWLAHVGVSLIGIAEARDAAGQGRQAAGARDRARTVFQTILERQPDNPRAKSQMQRIDKPEAQASACATTARQGN